MVQIPLRAWHSFYSFLCLKKIQNTMANHAGGPLAMQVTQTAKGSCFVKNMSKNPNSSKVMKCSNDDTMSIRLQSTCQLAQSSTELTRLQL